MTIHIYHMTLTCIAFLGERAFEGHSHRPAFPQADHRIEGREDSRDSGSFQRNSSLLPGAQREEGHCYFEGTETGRREMCCTLEEDGC